MYHCNYCNKDITGKVRIKCAACSDFDLCIECFSVGAEVTPHKSSHAYRVMVSKYSIFMCNVPFIGQEFILILLISNLQPSTLVFSSFVCM